MKPRTARLLTLLESGRWVCGDDLALEGIGWRFGARIHELRQDGYMVESRPCKAHPHTSRVGAYRLETQPVQMAMGAM